MVQSRLQLINGTGAYYLNVAANVYVQRATPYDSWESRELPGINITDGDEVPEQTLMAGAANERYRSLSVDIELMVNGTLSAEQVRKGIADIQYAIGIDPTWSGLAIDSRWTERTSRRTSRNRRSWRPPSQ